MIVRKLPSETFASDLGGEALRTDIPPLPNKIDYATLVLHPDIGGRLSIRMARVTLVALMYPRSTTVENAERLDMSHETFLGARVRVIEKLGAFHPVSVALNPERALTARIDAVTPCPRCGLRHVQVECYRLTIDDYAMMRNG